MNSVKIKAKVTIMLQQTCIPFMEMLSQQYSQMTHLVYTFFCNMKQQGELSLPLN